MVAILKYFLKLGFIGFGGPVALIGYIRQDLVEKSKTITEGEFERGLALSQISPGPVATQLAIYIGWLKKGVLGGFLVSVVFLLPSFLIVVALTMVYLRYGEMPWIHGLLFGMGAASLFIVWRSCYALSNSVVFKKTNLVPIYILGAVCTLYDARLGLAALFLAAVVGWIQKSWSNSLLWILSFAIVGFFIWNYIQPIAGVGAAQTDLSLGATTTDHTSLTNPTIFELWFYFLKAGLFIFGSGLALLPYVYQGGVQQLHWITHSDFMNAMSVGMVTPGPIIITVSFIGFIKLGLLGAIMALAAVLTPCFLIVCIFAPFMERSKDSIKFSAITQSIVAAATGTILAGSIQLSLKTLTSVKAISIFLIAFMISYLFKKIPPPAVIVAMGIIGILLV